MNRLDKYTNTDWFLDETIYKKLVKVPYVNSGTFQPMKWRSIMKCDKDGNLL